MAETDENGGEWRGMVSITSPKSNLFSGFLADGFGNGEGRSGGGLDSMMVGCSNWKQQQPLHGNGRNGNGNGNGGGSIAERRAARLGFNAPRLNTARFRTTSPLSSPSVRSPYLTIPPGLSPTSLLDSPVMLHNSQAQPSPTTGTFSLPSHILDAIPISASSNGDKDKDAGAESSFMFKPLGPHSFQCLSDAETRSPAMEEAEAKPQIPAPVQPQVDYDCQKRLLKPLTTLNSATGSPSTAEGSANMIVDSSCIPLQTSDANAASEQALQLVEQVRVEDTGSQQQLDGDQRGTYASTATGRPSEDGYNWRKYGQKQVKGSEYPRSYYKCTHQNCQVKKKIERSHDGQITEIIYKGGHNHPMPQPSRRSGIGSPFNLGDMLETGDDTGSYVKVEGGSTWRSTPQGSKDNSVNPDWRADGQERTSSTSVLTEVSDPLSTAQGKQLGVLESADTPELSSTLASHDDDDDRATQGSISLDNDNDDDESESKRRKKDSSLIEANLASRAVREPRVVVQTDSEVDILDDGYRWRKYGQKVVKGNPNPRSYYKCTSAGCSVRKHVERASHDLKYVITTYEGKHNHEVPAARSSSHLNSASGNVPPASSNTQAPLMLPRNTTIPKPEPHVQDMVPRFERKHEFGNEFFRPNNLGGFNTACYDMKLPAFHTSLPYGGFGSSAATHNATHQAAHIAQVVPDYPMAIPMNVPMSALSGYNNVGKAAVSSQAFISGQQAKDNDARFVRPKQEKDDGAYESHLSVNQLSNSSAGMYQQMMGGGYQL